MPKDILNVNVKITDIDEFEKLCSTMQSFCIDKRIDKNVREEYKEKILNIFSKTRYEEIAYREKPECPDCKRNSIVKIYNYELCENLKCGYVKKRG